MPPQVTVKFVNAGGVSRFESRYNSRIVIDRQGYRHQGKLVIAHETSHLCLNLLTNGANMQEQFRFLDEGFAEIISNRIAGNLKQYKTHALYTAAVQLHKNNLSFAKTQKWSKYFGAPKDGKRYAYEVGASFVFFVMDRFGEKKLKNLFIAIGLSRNFAVAIQSTLGKTAAEVEANWKAYLLKLPISFETPRIVKFTPPNNASGISTNISELSISFSVPMNTHIISIMTTRCDKGICYTNSYWKDQKTLIIRLPKKLLANHQYHIQFGHKGRTLQSLAGTPLPITTWKFTT